jgi:hypothetical protein
MGCCDGSPLTSPNFQDFLELQAEFEQHLADLRAHGGGQELAFSRMTVETSTTGTALIDLTGSPITFDAPAGPYMVELVVPVTASVVGGICNIALATGIVNLMTDQFERGTANVRRTLRCAVRVPTPVQNHAHPGEGVEVSYIGRITRDGASPAATVSTAITSAGSPVREAFLRAYTLGEGA